MKDMYHPVLDSSVLVLNSSLVAVDLTTVRRAFCLLCKDVAQVVEVSEGRYDFHGFESWQDVSAFKRRHGLADEHAEWVSTVNREIEVPRIIRLLFYDRYPERGVPLNRRNIFARDENSCQFCGRRFPSSELSIDHVIPLSLGGSTCWTNVVCACAACNKRKGGRTPRQAGMRLIRPAFEPKHNPEIKLKLRRRKYMSWKHFLDEAYWSVPLE
jgi:5-methylcytosine-specific restriction endonuclease McrA